MRRVGVVRAGMTEKERRLKKKERNKICTVSLHKAGLGWTVRNVWKGQRQITGMMMRMRMRMMRMMRMRMMVMRMMRDCPLVQH